MLVRLWEALRMKIRIPIWHGNNQTMTLSSFTPKRASHDRGCLKSMFCFPRAAPLLIYFDSCISIILEIAGSDLLGANP